LGLAARGDVTSEQAAYLEATIWSHLPGLKPLPADQFGIYQNGGRNCHSDPLALTQLLLTYHLLREHGTGAQRVFATPVAALDRVRVSREANVPEANAMNLDPNTFPMPACG
jgi:hypothetical protein